MGINLVKDIVSNSSPEIVNAEYVVLHSSNGPASRIIKSFNDPKSERSCHFIIDEDGTVYQTLETHKTGVTKGWHAGRSLLRLESGKILSEFNEFSIGIELINKNCNLYKYKPALLESLVGLIKHLKSEFPALSNPERVIGHEHISGYRGKVDPGHMFEWDWFYNQCYSESANKNIPREPKMPKEFLKMMTNIQDLTTKNGLKQEDVDAILRELSIFYQSSLGVSKLPI